jgi:hypothetical protein
MQTLSENYADVKRIDDLFRLSSWSSRTAEFGRLLLRRGSHGALHQRILWQSVLHQKIMARQASRLLQRYTGAHFGIADFIGSP